jgi:hypothetical protein
MNEPFQKVSRLPLNVDLFRHCRKWLKSTPSTLRNFGFPKRGNFVILFVIQISKALLESY